MVQEQKVKKIEFPVFITAHHPEMSLPHPNHNKSSMITQIPTSCLQSRWEEQSQIAFILTKRY